MGQNNLPPPPPNRTIDAWSKKQWKKTFSKRSLSIFHTIICKEIGKQSTNNKIRFRRMVSPTIWKNRWWRQWLVRSTMRFRLNNSQSSLICKLSWNVSSSGYGLTWWRMSFLTFSLACLAKNSLFNIMHSAPLDTWKWGGEYCFI